MRKSLPRAVVSLLSVTLSLLTLANCDPGLGAKVDVTSPALKVSSPSVPGGYFQGKLTLGGTVSDDRGIVSLKVSWQSPLGTKHREMVTSLVGSTWSIDLTSGSNGDLPEGKNVITVDATDASGKTASKELLVYIDNKPPTVLVTDPSGHGSLRPSATDYIDIRGEVDDQSPIVSVVVSLLGADGSTLLAKTSDGTSSFCVRIPLESDPASTYLIDQTIYRYKVTATDSAGNQNSYYFHKQDLASLLPAGKAFPNVAEIGRLNNLGVAGSISEPSQISYDQLSTIRLGLQSSSSPWGDFQYVQGPH